MLCTLNRIVAVLFLMMVSAGGAYAQFFEFGNPFFNQQRQQPRVKQTPPEFKGGQKAIDKYIEKTFKAPRDKDGRRYNVEGKVVVACIINEKGKVEQTQVLRQLLPAIDAEVQRVVRTMRFKPAMLGKKKVKSRLDIVFPIRRGRVSFFDLPTVEV